MSNSVENILPALPTEIWEQIFLNLPFTPLLLVRATCQYWKNIVENCPALRTNFVLRLRRGIIHQAPPPSLPVANAFICCGITKSVDLWWPPIGARITNICFSNCEVSLAVLNYTPNLKSLKLSNVDLAKRFDRIELKLSKLERLSLMRPSSGVLEELIQADLRLKALECSYIIASDVAEVSLIINLVKKVQDTLYELSFHHLELRAELFQGISKIERLRLKKFSFTENWLLEQSWNSSFAIKFARVQPTIEDLKLCISSSEQQEIYKLGQSLPRLKRFEMIHKRKTSLEAAPPFLGAMTSLECLKIDAFGPHQFVHHADVHKFPNLKQLILSGVCVKKDSLAQFLQHSSEIGTIALENVQFDRWADFLASLSVLKSLQKVELKSVYIAEFNEKINSIKVEANRSVRSLRLENVKAKDKVFSLIGMFPRLKEFHVGNSNMCDWIEEAREIVRFNQHEMFLKM